MTKIKQIAAFLPADIRQEVFSRGKARGLSESAFCLEAVRWFLKTDAARTTNFAVRELEGRLRAGIGKVVYRQMRAGVPPSRPSKRSEKGSMWGRLGVVLREAEAAAAALRELDHEKTPQQ